MRVSGVGRMPSATVSEDQRSSAPQTLQTSQQASSQAQQQMANSHAHLNGGGGYVNGTTDPSGQEVSGQTTLGLIAAPSGTTHYYYYQQANSSPQVRYPSAMHQIYGHPMALQVPQGQQHPELGPHVASNQGSMGGGGPVSHELSKTNLYIKGLTQNTTDRDLFNLCAPYGTIISTKAILDKDTQKCKGYGFVDFNTASEAENAVKALLAQGIQAQMAKVSPSQSLNSQIEPDPTNLYIANLPAHMSETDLENLLSSHGSVISTRILRDANLQSRGVGFARMESKEKCEQIIHLFNGKKLQGSSEGLLVKFADGGNKKRLQQQQALQGGYQHSGPLHSGGQMGHHGQQHNGSAQPHEVKSSPSGGHHGHHLSHHNGAPSGGGQDHQGGHRAQWAPRSQDADATAALYGTDGTLVSQHSPIGIVQTAAGYHVSAQGRSAYGTPHPQLGGGGALQIGGALQYAMQAANGIYGAYMTAGQQQPPAPAQYIIHSGPAPHSGHPHSAPHGPGPHGGAFGPTATLDGTTLYAAHVGALGPAQLAQQMQQLQIGSPHGGAAGHHLVQHYNAGSYMTAMLPSMQAAATNGAEVGPASVDSGVGGDPQADASQQQVYQSASSNQSSTQYQTSSGGGNGGGASSGGSGSNSGVVVGGGSASGVVGGASTAQNTNNAQK